MAGRRRSKVKVSRKDIQELYVDRQMSLREVAAELDTTQTTIMNKVRKYGVELRGKGAARRLAIEQGKVVPPRIHNFDETFFDEIGPLQAYAMGLIWAGGYIVDKGVNLMCGDENIDICSKLKELLKMQSYPVCIEAARQTPMWASEIGSANLSRRLEELGLPRGTHTVITLPSLSEECHIDFVRGWWERRGFTSLAPNVLEGINEWAFPNIEMDYWKTKIFNSSFKTADNVQEAYDALYGNRTHPKFYISRRRASFIESGAAGAADSVAREMYNTLVDLPATPDRSPPDIHTWTGSILIGRKWPG